MEAELMSSFGHYEVTYFNWLSAYFALQNYGSCFIRFAKNRFRRDFDSRFYFENELLMVFYFDWTMILFSRVDANSLHLLEQRQLFRFFH